MSRRPKVRHRVITRRSPSRLSVTLSAGAAALVTGFTFAQCLANPSPISIVAAVCATMFQFLLLSYYDRLFDIQLLGDLVADRVQAGTGGNRDCQSWTTISIAPREDQS